MHRSFGREAGTLGLLAVAYHSIVQVTTSKLGYLAVVGGWVVRDV